MSVQFKFKNLVGDKRRREILHALDQAGFSAESLFPSQKRAALASIFTIPNAEAKDLEAINAILSKYSSDIDYVEAAPERSLKF
jgi:hypothetical protein